MAALYERNLLTADLTAAHVAAAWSAAEYPEDYLDSEDWKALFDEAGFTDDNGGRAERPDLPIRLYRGAPAHRRGRMSWTTSRDTAAAFAGGRGFRESGIVWTAVIDEPWRLLAVCHGRKEDEYVVDTDGLTIEEWR